jgi:hypothetical protein
MTTDEFRKLSAVAALLILHDRAELMLQSPSELGVGLFLSAGDGDSNAEEALSAPVQGEVGRNVTGERDWP